MPTIDDCANAESAVTSDGQLAVQFSSIDLWSNGETTQPASALAGTSQGGEWYQGSGTCANLT